MTDPAAALPAADPDEALLAVEGLRLSFDTAAGPRPGLLGVDFRVGRGEIVAMVGESGSGKTISALAAIGLLPAAARITGGRIALEGRALVDGARRAWNGVRGARIGMVFQEPMTSLNPVLPVGEQVAETLVRHRGLGWGAAQAEAVRLLDRVGIPDARRRAGQYVHQLSGGMRQRVMIASAISCGPRLLIADEPTTALDVTVQAQILDLLRALRDDTGMGVLFITHDLGVVAEVAERCYVMYAGRVVEQGTTRDILADPLMPYTRGLLASLPRPDRPRARLSVIPGTVADPAAALPGCAFAPRCADHRPDCDRAVPALEPAGAGRAVRCVRWRGLRGSVAAAPADPPPATADAPPEVSEALLEAAGLVKHFPLGTAVLGRGRQVVRAVDGVDLTVRRGEVVSLVGESGSGKTTIGRCLLRLVEPTAGTVRFDGIDLRRLGTRGMAALRRRLQIVFQDPFASLNPKLTVGEAIAEPVRVHGLARGAALQERVVALLERVGLTADHAGRHPAAFSGGQRQRVAIARALALGPELLVADEAVSALDVSIRAQITNLLQDLQAQLDLTLLFIAHDLSLVRQISDRVVILYLGRVMEEGPTAAVFDRPRHPYTQALLSAIPVPDPDRRRDRIVLAGDVPSPLAPPSGCVFRTRCPIATAECARAVPPPRAVGPDHSAACLYAE